MPRKPKTVGKREKHDGFPIEWQTMFVGRYRPAFKGTSAPYFDKSDKLWKIVLYDTLKPEHIIYEFETKSYNKVLYNHYRK